MAKKSLLDVAAAGTSVFDQLATGNTVNIKDIQKDKGAQKEKSTKKDKSVQKQEDAQKPTKQLGRPREFEERGRFNLLLSPELRDYLIVAAARETIATKKRMSPTGYITKLIRQDMEKHKDD